MTLIEIESKYGKQIVDWINDSISNGTIKPIYQLGKGCFTVKLRNPKCIRHSLKMNDPFTIDDWGNIEPPEYLRFSDTVQVVVDQ